MRCLAVDLSDLKKSAAKQVSDQQLPIGQTMRLFCCVDSLEIATSMIFVLKNMRHQTASPWLL